MFCTPKVFYIRATALFDKYFHTFSSKKLSTSDQCVKSEAYINGNENLSINSRRSAPIHKTSKRINQYSGKESASERGSMEDHPRGHPSSCDIVLK